MPKGTFEEFIVNVLDVAQDFAIENDAIITFGSTNQEPEVYQRGGSPLQEELLYIIKSRAKGIFYLRFRKMDNIQFRVFIDNGSISLILDHDLERITAYKSDEFNRGIDNIKGDFRQRLKKCLYIMWDFEYALQMLFSNQPE